MFWDYPRKCCPSGQIAVWVVKMLCLSQRSKSCEIPRVERTLVSFMPESLGLSKMEAMVAPTAVALVNITSPEKNIRKTQNKSW
jgi:hypothetical protein